jgi:hypothetical protein
VFVDPVKVDHMMLDLCFSESFRYCGSGQNNNATIMIIADQAFQAFTADQAGCAK